MRRSRAISVMTLGLAAVLSAAAYEFPVSDYSIREAYFLGNRKDERSDEFLSQYVKRLPLPKSGPHVAEIELRTPYQQIVLRARKAPDGYSSQLAREDYRRSADTVIVRVLILLTPTYPGHSPVQPVQSEPVRLRGEDFWREFRFGLYQRSEIQQRRISAQPIYTSSDFGLPGLVGTEVEIGFKASDLTDAPARVVVVTPAKQRIEAGFDLAKLR